MYFTSGIAVTLEGIALGIAGFMGVGAVYLDGRSGTFAVIIIGTVVGFAVNLDFFAATAIGEAVCHGTFRTLLKTAAACLAGRSSIFAGDINLTLGTELLFVVNTFDC